MHGASSVPANVLPPAPLHPSGLPLPLHQSSEISPFRPSTEKISTLRPTIASQMSDALEEAGVIDDVQDDQGDGLDDISMFDPEKKSSVSIEDAQRSLSSEGSGGGGDVSALQESRRMSVSFAPMHKVIITTILNVHRRCPCSPRRRSPRAAADMWRRTATPRRLMVRRVPRA